MYLLLRGSSIATVEAELDFGRHAILLYRWSCAVKTNNQMGKDLLLPSRINILPCKRANLSQTHPGSSRLLHTIAWGPGAPSQTPWQSGGGDHDRRKLVGGGVGHG